MHRLRPMFQKHFHCPKCLDLFPTIWALKAHQDLCLQTGRTAVKTLTAPEVIKRLAPDASDAGATIAILNRWLDRGDGIAIYENQDLGHPELGHVQFLSYGSPAAQLETEEPPVRLPDIGGAINWRYQLVGVYRGAML